MFVGLPKKNGKRQDGSKGMGERWLWWVRLVTKDGKTIYLLECKWKVKP